MATKKSNYKNKFITYIKKHLDAMFWIVIISLTVIFYYIAPIAADID